MLSSDEITKTWHSPRSALSAGLLPQYIA